MKHDPKVFFLTLLLVGAVQTSGCKHKDSQEETTNVAAESASAGARPGGEHRSRPTFEALDTNGDGRITQEEAGPRWRFLSRADSNHDGEVTKEEFEARRLPGRN